MIIEPKFVFKCVNAYPPVKGRGGIPTRAVFDTAQKLCSFLEGINWTEPRSLSLIPVGMMTYNLGVQYRFDMGGLPASSDIQWGPRFIVGIAVRDDMVLAPADKKEEYDPFAQVITRRFDWQPVNLADYDAVITPRLVQIWPQVNPESSVLKRFLDMVATAQRFEIRNLSKARDGR